MELDDMFLIGKRPVTLRLVLGLMEDADNSLETYRWATPALLHSIHTKDTTLSDYVKEVFEQKGLTPYKPYKEEEQAERLSDALEGKDSAGGTDGAEGCKGIAAVLSEEPLVGGVPHLRGPSGVWYQGEPLQGVH